MNVHRLIFYFGFATGWFIGLASAPAHAEELVWRNDLEAAYRAARANNGQVLVRVGAEWCGWCEKLGEELEKPQVQKELKRFTLVYLDADDDADQVRRLGVGPIPALRVFSGEGKLVAMHDGYLDDRQLIDWLNQESGAAAEPPPEFLTGSGPLDDEQVKQLLRELGRREASRREAAIRRLLPHADAAAAGIVEVLGSRKLAAQLSALELLQAWRAPIDGIDPWRAETIDETRLAALNAWAEKAAAPPADEPLSPDELAAAQREIDKLLAADAVEAEAIAARLARYATALLPEVYQRLKQIESDHDRERLTWLRYRLTATDALALGWPGGLARLAANDAATRHEAAQELAARATAADEPLLLEMFSDPDPLVRELSLKALHAVGGQRVSQALVRLLDDPEPNVRAAVLKQLAESPATTVVSTIAKYVAKEQDADLVVHAVRLLRATGGKSAIDALVGLLDHDSWRVRAEAAEALGECVSSNERQVSDSVKAEVYVDLIDALDDEDGFVVSRAMLGLKSADVPAMIEPLAVAAEKRPELAKTAAEVMLGGQHVRAQAIKRLDGWTKHANPELRAAGLLGLCQASVDDGDAYRQGLTDESEKVRLAVAAALFEKFEELRPYSEEYIEATANSFGGEIEMQIDVSEFTPIAPVETPSLWGGLKRLLLGSKQKQPADGANVEEPPNYGTLAERLAAREGDPAPDKEDEADEEMETSQRPVAEPAAVPVPVEVAPLEAPPPPAATSTPTDNKGRDRTDPWEPWLADFRSDEHRRRWTEPLVEPLEKMLKSEDRNERLAAALPLVALGREEESLAVLRALAAADRNFIGDAGRALPWLPWPTRLAWFEELRQLAAAPDTEIELAGRFVVLRDVRAAAPLWQMLAGEQLTAAAAQSLLDDLKRAYRVGQPHFGNGPAPSPQLDVDQAKQLAKAGASWQRLAALSLLFAVDQEAVAEIARGTYEDERQSDANRQDALQFLLLVEEDEQARRIAMTALRSGRPGARRLALGFLARGREALENFRGGEFHVELAAESPVFAYVETKPAKPIELPDDLQPDDVRPFLADADGALAGFAGYLLTQMGEPAGLEPLVKQWRAAGTSSSVWTPLVYRAVAALDDAGHADLLVEIYENIEQNAVDVRDFYWTIRTMTGPELLKLRKRIRDDVGMDQLR